MAWPSFTADEVISGRGGKTTGASLFEQQDALIPIRHWGWAFDEVSTMAAAAAAVVTEVWRPPDYAVVGTQKQKIKVYLKSDDVGASPEAYVRFRLYDGANTETSNTITTSAPGAYELTAWMIADIPTNMQGAVGTIYLDLWTNGVGNTAYAKAELLVGNCTIDTS